LTDTQMLSYLFEYGSKAVLICSILHTLLPPWENFEEWPVLQRYYKLFVFLVGYIALNARSTIYSHKISLEKQVSDGVKYHVDQEKIAKAIAEQKLDDPNVEVEKGKK
jgi:hypothetical protein